MKSDPMPVTTTDDDPPPLLLRQAMVRISDLVGNPDNPRVHQKERLKQGVKDFGQYKGSIVVNERTGWMVTGHGTAEAMAAAGKEWAQVSYIDVDQERAEEILLWDNWSSDSASNDDRLLAEMLRRLAEGGGIERSGFNLGDLDALEALLNHQPWEDPDEIGDILDKADESAWPEIKCKLAPALHERFMQAHGSDDGARIMTLIGLAGL